MFYSRFQHLPSFVSVLPFNSARCPDHSSPIPPNYLPLVHLKWPPLAKLSSFIPPNRITVLKRRENVHLFSKALLYLNPFLHPTRSLYSDLYYFPSPIFKDRQGFLSFLLISFILVSPFLRPITLLFRPSLLAYLPLSFSDISEVSFCHLLWCSLIYF